MSNRVVRGARGGFTIIELLVFIGIITAIMGMILPAIQRIREAYHRMVCMNQLRQIGVAFTNHLHSRNVYPTSGGDVFSSGVLWDNGIRWPMPAYPMPRVSSYFTPGVGPYGSIAPNLEPATAPHQDWGWAYQILPYLAEDNLWNLPNARDAEVAAWTIPLYFCPSRRRPQGLVHGPAEGGPHYPPFGQRGAIDYAGNGGTFGCDDPRIPRNRRPWHEKMDFPNREVSESYPPFRNGLLVKSRYWPRRPLEPWLPAVYVDVPLRAADVRDGLSSTLLVGEKRIDTRVMGDVQLGDQFGWTSGHSCDTIRTGSFWWCQDPPCSIRYLVSIDTPTPDHVPPNPADVTYHRPVTHEGFGSSHLRGINALFADGSVRVIRYDLSLDAVSVPVWHPRVEVTPANPPFMRLSLFQRLLHRMDGSSLNPADWE
jgi:prepilin-type processing-associated H-X9-DG protein